MSPTGCFSWAKRPSTTGSIRCPAGCSSDSWRNFPPTPGRATPCSSSARLGSPWAPPSRRSKRSRRPAMTPVPGKPQEARFWEAETLYKMKRYNDARADYARVTAAEPPSPLLPDALYRARLDRSRAQEARCGGERLQATCQGVSRHATAPSRYHPTRAGPHRDQARRRGGHPARGLPRTSIPTTELVPESRYFLARAPSRPAIRPEGSPSFATSREPIRITSWCPPRAARRGHQLKWARRRSWPRSTRPSMALRSRPRPEALYDAGALAAGTRSPGTWRRRGARFARNSRITRSPAGPPWSRPRRPSQEQFKDAAALARAASQELRGCRAGRGVPVSARAR